MSIETFIAKKKRLKELETGELKPMILSATETLTEKIMDELKPKIVKEAQNIVQDAVDNLVRNVRKGDTGSQGLTGATGLAGNDGKDGKHGKEGKQGKNGIDGLNGKDGSPDTPEEIVKKLNTLEELIDPKTIKGLKETFKEYAKAISEAGAKKMGGAGGGGFTDYNFIDDETPSGSVNGSNKVFTTASKPNPTTSLKVFVNGQRMRITEDYTFSGSTITFITAPPSTSIVLVDYRK